MKVKDICTRVDILAAIVVACYIAYKVNSFALTLLVALMLGVQ